MNEHCHRWLSWWRDHCDHDPPPEVHLWLNAKQKVTVQTGKKSWVQITIFNGKINYIAHLKSFQTVFDQHEERFYLHISASRPGLGSLVNQIKSHCSNPAFVLMKSYSINCKYPISRYSMGYASKRWYSDKPWSSWQMDIHHHNYHIFIIFIVYNSVWPIPSLSYI